MLKHTGKGPLLFFLLLIKETTEDGAVLNSLTYQNKWQENCTKVIIIFVMPYCIYCAIFNAKTDGTTMLSYNNV